MVSTATTGGATAWPVCRREGGYWSIAFAGEAFRLKYLKGLHYLAYLLRHPGREFHVLDLVAAGQGAEAGGPRMSPARDDDLHKARLSDTGPVLMSRPRLPTGRGCASWRTTWPRRHRGRTRSGPLERARRCSSRPTSRLQPWG